MIDFARASYLGMRHPSRALRGWDFLTVGKPAAIAEPAEHKQLAGAIARLQGCEAGVLARSTLHFIWDLFNIWSCANVSLYVDEGVYQITRWGIELARLRGVPVAWFGHHDWRSLKRRVAGSSLSQRRPIVITDGWCARCGRIAPINRYLEIIQLTKGLLMIDDTQALGIIGDRRQKSHGPFGKGGGGSLRWFGLHDPNIVVVSSLAKAFGAPLCALSSSGQFIRRFKQKSETRVHTSPPSTADTHAGELALAVNAGKGDVLRKRLSSFIHHFRCLMREIGLTLKGGMFPVQLLSRSNDIDPVKLYRQLDHAGIRTVLLRKDLLHPAQLAFIINAGHSRFEIDFTVRTIQRFLPKSRTKQKRATNRGVNTRHLWI